MLSGLSAVRFVAVPAPARFTRDNADATGVIITGGWIASTAVAGYYGSNYLSDGNPAVKGAHSVSFAPGSLGSTGVFEVFARWTYGSDRATNARFDILTATGTKTVLVNQRTRGKLWVSLGYFRLNAFGATVTVRNDGADGLVIADAVQVVRVSD